MDLAAAFHFSADPARGGRTRSERLLERAMRVAGRAGRDVAEARRRVGEAGEELPSVPGVAVRRATTELGIEREEGDGVGAPVVQVDMGLGLPEIGDGRARLAWSSGGGGGGSARMSVRKSVGSVRSSRSSTGSGASSASDNRLPPAKGGRRKSRSGERGKSASTSLSISSLGSSSGAGSTGGASSKLSAPVSAKDATGARRLSVAMISDITELSGERDAEEEDNTDDDDVIAGVVSGSSSRPPSNEFGARLDQARMTKVHVNDGGGTSRPGSRRQSVSVSVSNSRRSSIVGGVALRQSRPGSRRGTEHELRLNPQFNFNRRASSRRGSIVTSLAVGGLAGTDAATRASRVRRSTITGNANGTVSMSLNGSRRPSVSMIGDGGTFLTGLPRPRVYGSGSAFKRFRRLARIIAAGNHFTKYLSRILKNPIQWGWEFDADNIENSEAVQRRRLQKGLVSTDFSVSRLFNTKKNFSGWLPSEMRELFRKPPEKRTEIGLQEMVTWASGMKAFREHKPAVQRMLLAVGRYERWHAHRTIVREGHAAINFYIILDGEVEVSKVNRPLADAALEKIDASATSAGRTREELVAETERLYTDVLGTQCSGEAFGEMGLAGKGECRFATVTTRRMTEFLVVDGEAYQVIMAHTLDADIGDKVAALSRVDILKTLSCHVKRVVPYADLRRYANDEVVVKEGEVCNHLFFVSEGTCRIIKAVNFLKIWVSRTRYVLEPINLARGLSDRRKLETMDPPCKIVTKFLVIKRLYAGDFFFDGEDTITYIPSSGLAVAVAKTSVVAEYDVELVKISRLDFNKFSTRGTWECYMDKMQEAPMPGFVEMGNEFMTKRTWQVYKDKEVGKLVAETKRSLKTGMQNSFSRFHCGTL
ncbi:Cyclic nucleotide-binding domain-containing protein 2 [Irineochytrium annulatum]|nr:Cyclic nucleotide-binding domain-containing protein 2 [Irineochytrium annulatum]